MNRVWLIVRQLWSRRWIVPTLVVLAGMAGLARLGVWQLDRLEQRRVANAQLLAVLEGEPLALTGESLSENLADLKDRAAFAEGGFDFERQVLIKLQNYQGRAGGHLVTPFQIAGSEKAILVNRGWIPDAETAVSAWAQFDEPDMVQVEGVLALTETLSRAEGNTAVANEPQAEWFRVDIEAIQAQMPYELLPMYLILAPSDNPAREFPIRLEPEIDLSEGSHMSYAVQWFLFSATLGVIYVVYVSKQTEDRGIGD